MDDETFNQLYQLLIEEDIIDSSVSMDLLKYSEMLTLIKVKFATMKSQVQTLLSSLTFIAIYHL